MSRNPHVDQALSDLANALQVAVPLAMRQARICQDAAADAANLEAAVTRARAGAAATSAEQRAMTLMPKVAMNVRSWLGELIAAFGSTAIGLVLATGPHGCNDQGRRKRKAAKKR